MTVETLGIDIAKNVFQLHGVNHHGSVLLKLRGDARSASRHCCIGRALHDPWSKHARARSAGLVSFVRRQKNDGNDAEAICTAARQPHIPLVPKKTVELTPMACEAIAELYDLMRDLDRRIGLFDQKVDRVFHSSEPCQRIAKIKGVGPKTATAIVAAIGDGAEFKNGRHLAACVGLVPRQFSSGDRTTLMGISKRGNQHLRSLLVHGARAIVRTAPSKTDPNNALVYQLRQRRGFNRATVAVANKNARIIWAVLRTGEPYRAVF